MKSSPRAGAAEKQFLILQCRGPPAGGKGLFRLRDRERQAVAGQGVPQNELDVLEIPLGAGAALSWHPEDPVVERRAHPRRERRRRRQPALCQHSFRSAGYLFRRPPVEGTGTRLESGARALLRNREKKARG